MKLLPLILTFLVALLTFVSGMTTVPKSVGLQQGKQQAGCHGGPGGGGPPPPPPTNSTG